MAQPPYRPPPCRPLRSRVIPRVEQVVNEVCCLRYYPVAAADHVGDQPRPPGLVAGAEARRVVAVVVLVEVDVVPPLRVVLQLVHPAVAGPPAVGAPGEDGDEPSPRALRAL